MKKNLLIISCITIANAGLTDFKTIEAAKQAYEAKEYTKSQILYEDLDQSLPQTKYDIGNTQYKSKNSYNFV